MSNTYNPGALHLRKVTFCHIHSQPLFLEQESSGQVLLVFCRMATLSSMKLVICWSGSQIRRTEESQG